MHTRDHSFLGGTKQKSPSNLNDSDKHGYGNLRKQSVVQKVSEGSANKMKKLDYNGDWPANSRHKNRSFDPKAILRSMKDATADNQERQANISGIKDTSKSQIKSRTVKEGKSKGKIV